jgi:hypothetical protein
MGKSINLLRSLLPSEQLSQDMLIGSAGEHNKRDLMIFIMPILDTTRQDRNIGESCLFIAYNNIRTQCMEHHISKTGKEGLN